VAVRRCEQLHRQGDQPEGQGAAPHCTCHGVRHLLTPPMAPRHSAVRMSARTGRHSCGVRWPSAMRTLRNMGTSWTHLPRCAASIRCIAFGSPHAPQALDLAAPCLRLSHRTAHRRAVLRRRGRPEPAPAHRFHGVTQWPSGRVSVTITGTRPRRTPWSRRRELP
jgi:hypothetical protein